MTQEPIMKTNAGAIKDVLAALSPIVEPRNTIPILGSVKIEDGQAVATDMDIEVSVAAPVAGKQSNPLCFQLRPVTKLFQHINQDEAVSFSADTHATSIKFNGSEYAVPSYSHSEFPMIPWNEGSAQSTRIDNAGICAALGRVSFAISTEETRYYLNGVAFSKDQNDNPVLVATDGHRMAIKPIPLSPDGFEGRIIPRKTTRYIASRRKEAQSCEFDGSKVRFSFGGLTITSKLIDGDFPDWSRVVPKAPQPILSVNPVQLSRVIARMESFGSITGIKLESHGQGIVLTKGHDWDGKARETIKCDLSRDSDFVFGFNGKYLLEILAQFKGSESVTFSSEGDGGGSPLLITANDDDLQCILMLMRV